MAEARSAVNYRVEKANLHFQVTEEEVILRISKDAIPSSLLRIRRGIKSKTIRIKNHITNAFHPAPPLHWAFLVSAPAALMTSFPPSSSSSALVSSSSSSSSWSLSSQSLSSLAQLLWDLRDYLPSFLTSSEIGSVAVISFSVGTATILGLSFLRRFFLAALLNYRGWLYDNPKKTNWKTAVWGILVKAVSGQHPLRLTSQKHLLYSSQKSLPKLPVPSLESTCNKYLLSVKPLLSEEEYAEMKKLVEAFKKKEGRRLQFLLKIKSWISDNYVADWWEKYVYLRGRSPILVNSNYYILDLGLPNPPTTSQVARSAMVIRTILDFKYDIDHELLEPMKIRGTVPMCMWQYERMFYTTRIPGKDCDSLFHDDSAHTSHIVVLRKGAFYSLDIIDEKGKPIPAPDLEVQLKWIIRDADRQKASEAESKIPSLTADNRTTWALAREEFFSYGINKQSLDWIEKAMFVLSLDDEMSGEDWTSMANSLFTGNGKNRWADKSFNVVSFPNGRVGLNVEHSWADAPVMSHLWEYTLLMSEEDKFGPDGMCLREKPIVARRPPTRLRWDLSQKAEKVIETSYENAIKLISDVDLEVLTFLGYGKGVMKGCGMSPDAYVQMAMQVAYHRDTAHFPLTYESSMTRLFLKGRTETVRPVSLASVAFVKAFEDPSVPAAEKIKLLRKAAESHQNYYRDCMAGNGIDRHLFGLYVVSQGMGVDSKFLKSALSMEWKLSTSQQPQGQVPFWNPNRSKEEEAKASPGGGFGPVSDTGYGVSYMIAGDYKLRFHISSKKSSSETDSARLGKHIFKVLDEMKALFEAAA